MLTHGNLIANLEQASVWVSPVLKPGQEIVITALPLYHIFSLMANCLLFIKLGGLNVLITDPRDIPRFIKELKRWRFTAITGVNTLFKALVNAPYIKQVNFSFLKFALGGGAPVQSIVSEQWHTLTGTPLTEAYGLSEASPAVCINPVGSIHQGTVGLPLPSTEVSIRDEADQVLPQGQEGEIWIRGPQVMQGYWNKAEETAQVLTSERWLKTGDIGLLDAQGFLKITDRKKDMILVSGFRVFPNEVEEVVSLFPGVLDCAAIGVPSEHSGEMVKIFIVTKQTDFDIAQLLNFCHQRLTGYKVPKLVEFRDELPKTPIGKVLRRALR